MKKIFLLMLLVNSFQLLYAQSWNITGNSGLTTSNFLGSTDNKDVIFKTKNIEHGRLAATGFWRFGSATNFVKIDSSGNFTFGGSGVYRVANNKYAFQSTANPNYGLFFNSTIPQFEFRNGSAAPVFSVNGNNGNGVFNGTLKVGSYTLPATDGTNGQVLKTNGTGVLTWTNDNNTVYTGGVGINITGNTITNTNPDQPVTLTGSGATTVTGAYPNFNVSSTDNNTIYTAGTGINISGTVISNTGDLDATDDANLSLSNLSATAINQHLLPNTDNAYDLGSAGLQWKNVNLYTLRFADASQQTTAFIPSALNQTLLPSIDNTVDIGSSSLHWQNVYLTNLKFTDGSTQSTAFLPGAANSSLIPLIDNAYDLGSSSFHWKDLYLKNSLYLDANRFLNNSGTGNVFVGNDAGISNTGELNTAIGFQSLYSNVDGFQNTSTGYQSLYSNISGADNIANGVNALFSNTEGNKNIAIGNSTLYSNDGGEHNIAVGQEALYNNTGSNNIAIGYQAGYSNTSGLGNTFLGGLAGYANTSGSENTFVGGNCGAANTTGNSNAFFATNAGHLNTTGDNNSFVGYWSGFSNTSGSNNTALGSYSGFSNTTGTSNSFLGWETGYSNTTGFDNSFLGRDAGYNNTSGSNNSFYGTQAGYSNTTANGNSFFGYAAGLSNTSDQNAFFGFQAGTNNTAGAGGAFFGNQAGLHNTTGGNNSFFGLLAGGNNTTGNNNSFVGLQSGVFNTTGSNNSFVGLQAGEFNNGNSNTFIGSGAGQFSSSNNSSCLGYGSGVSADNQVRIGNSSVTSIGGFANWTNISDGRYKKNIKENVPGLEFINALKPITYTLDINGINTFFRKNIPAEKNVNGSASTSPQEDVKGILEKQKIVYTGFVAQDVEKAAKELGYDFSGVDAPKNDKDLYGLRYAEFVVPLVKAVQELSVMIDKKDTAIETLQKENRDQQQIINTLIIRLDKIEQAMSKCCPAYQSSASTSEITFNAVNNAKLEQNIPNPFSQSTDINYYIPASVKQAQILITDMNGNKIKLQTVAPGYGKVTIKAGELASGIYTYILYADGKMVDTKKMVLTK